MGGRVASCRPHPKHVDVKTNANQKKASLLSSLPMQR
jgi:hypothetical protein